MGSPASAGMGCSNRCADRLNPVLLPLRPFPPLHWWRAAQSPGVRVDVGEHYPKRTFRNRFSLATASGMTSLTLPVLRRGGVPKPQSETLRSRGDDVKLWRSIQTAYGATPYFEEMKPELEALFLDGPDDLGAWNWASIRWSAEWLGVKVPQASEAQMVERGTVGHDAEDERLRALCAPDLQPWPHIWQDRMTPDCGALSVLDLLLHCGPEAAGRITPLPPSGSRRPE